jgi:hypothetical protein
MSAMQQRSFESRIAKPAAWRLALAPPEPAPRVTRDHERLITAGVPDGLEGAASIVVPAALRHSINVTAGAGFLVTVALSSR